MKGFCIGFVLFFALPVFGTPSPVSGIETAGEVRPHSGTHFWELGLIPIQSGGRTKPLDSFAREVVLFTTGSRNFENWDPVDLVMSWISEPKSWEEKPFVQVNRIDVRRQLGLDEQKRWFSPSELYRNAALGQYAERLQPTGPMAPKPSPREEEFRHVLDRIGYFHALITGEAWSIIPHSPAWENLAIQGKQSGQIQSQFLEFIRSYRRVETGVADAQEDLVRSAQRLRSEIENQITDWNSTSAQKLKVEVFYNRMRPFLWAWIFYLSAAMTGMIALSLRRGAVISNALMGGAFTAHVSGILMRCFVAGRPPVTNMYESVIWVSLGTVIFSLIIYFLHRQRMSLIVSSVLAAFALIASDLAPAILDPGIRPLVPVLRSNYWLTIHVLTITLGYAAFALTLGLSNVTLFHYLKPGLDFRKKVDSMNLLTYRAMQFGVVLLAAGTILGGVWADYSWGRFWGWDPKEVWALVALLSYLVILHARYTAWTGPFGFASWTVIAFLSVLMAWYGVNFVLGAGLHTYGFASGGLPWILGFIGLQLGYVGLVAWRQAERTAFSGKKSILRVE